jgi:putative transposase
LSLKVNRIIIWKNVNWKQECKLKNFVQIPHARLISMIQYKWFLQWIEVILTEESYTSKIDHLNYEIMEKQENYSWQRIYRWLFQSTKLINADVNWAIWIMRKVSGDFFLRRIASKGLVYNPVRVNID